MAGDLGRVTWIDEDGRTWVSLCPAGTARGDEWRYARLGPPPVAEALEAAGWSHDAANDVQAGLVAIGAVRAVDMKQRGIPEQIDGVIRRAVRGSVQTVIDTFLLSSA